MPHPMLRPSLCFADSVALLASASLMVVVATPMAVEVGVVQPPSNQVALERVVGVLSDADAPPPPARGTWTRFVPQAPAPPEPVPSPPSRSALAEHSSPAFPPKSPRSRPATPPPGLAPGATITATQHAHARLSLHRPDRAALVRYQASLSALTRLSHTRTVRLPDGPRSAAEEPIAHIPLSAGLESWRVSRDLVLSGHLPHPDLIQTESFVAATGLGVEPGETARADAVLARSTEDPKVVWVHVGVAAPLRQASTAVPLDLVVLIDTSGSMGVSGALDHARAAVAELVGQLGPHDRLTVLSFEGTASEVLPGTEGATRAEVTEAMASLRASGATDAATGVDAGLSAIRHRRARRGRSNPQLVLFTDGDVMSTGRARWAAAAQKVQDAGVGLTVLGLGQAWAEAAPVEAHIAGVGGHHISARDGQEAATLLAAHLHAPVASPQTTARLSVVMDPRVVDTYEVVGWSGAGPGRVMEEGTHPVQLDAGQHASAVLRVRLHDAPGSSERLGTLRLGLEGQERPLHQPLETPNNGLPSVDAVSELAMAVAAVELADALRDADPEALDAVAETIATLQRSAHPSDGQLLRVARRAAQLARLPVVVAGEGTALDPRLSELVQTLGTECFVDLEVRRGPIHGTVTARARFLRGRLAGATILHDPLADRMLEACIVRQLQRWDPPAGIEGDLLLPLMWAPVAAERGPGPD